MSLVRKTDIVSDMQSKLIGQFKDSLRVNDLLAVFAGQLQDIENTTIDIFESLRLSAATGAQLDLFGVLLDEERGGRSDASYSLSLRAKVLLNTSQGTTEDLYALVEGAVGQELPLRLTEVGDATFILESLVGLDPNTIDAERVRSFVRRGRAAGVRALVFLPAQNSFGFDSNQGYDIGIYSTITEA